MSGVHRGVTNRPKGVSSLRRALTTDTYPQRVVDQHGPVGLVARAMLPIRDDRPATSLVGGDEIGEHPCGLHLECVLQCARHLFERLGVRQW